MFGEVLETIFLHNFWLTVTFIVKVSCQSNRHYNEYCCYIECRYKEGWLYFQHTYVLQYEYLIWVPNDMPKHAGRMADSTVADKFLLQE